MVKKPEHIEKLFRDSLGDDRVQPSQKVWSRIHRRLLLKTFLEFNPARFNVWYLIAAVVLVTSLLVFTLRKPAMAPIPSPVTGTVENRQAPAINAGPENHTEDTAREALPSGPGNPGRRDRFCPGNPETIDRCVRQKTASGKTGNSTFPCPAARHRPFRYSAGFRRRNTGPRPGRYRHLPSHGPRAHATGALRTFGRQGLCSAHGPVHQYVTEQHLLAVEFRRRANFTLAFPPAPVSTIRGRIS